MRASSTTASHVWLDMSPAQMERRCGIDEALQRTRGIRCWTASLDVRDASASMWRNER